jgi:hypothetical protein
LTQRVEELRAGIQSLHQQTGYGDLEHAELGLEIVHHALEEVEEHSGLGGLIPHEPDAAAHRQAAGWLHDVQRIQGEATTFLATHPSEDLGTALKALTIAAGSLEEVEERYE